MILKGFNGRNACILVASLSMNLLTFTIYILQYDDTITNDILNYTFDIQKNQVPKLVKKIKFKVNLFEKV